MRRRTTWLAACAAAVALGPWLPGWMAAAGLDVWAAPALRREVAAIRAEGAELDGTITDIRDQILAKERLSAELSAGRITLAEATDPVAARGGDHPRIGDALRLLYPDAATDRERVARHVIDYTRTQLADPAARDQLADRMTTELTTLFPAVHPAGTQTMG